MTLVAPQIRIRRPRLATLLTGAGIALVPWMAVLAQTLPQTVEVSNWPAAWIGLDAGLTVGLVGTGVLLRRGDPRVSPAAAATGALLLMDAWFDVTTAAAGPELATAVALAVLAELPLAVACGVVAGRRA
ncbi:hypothetical protein [Streptomyces sp. BPTC-684]|uniref:hypothetical protein n=1 Tax=Streptomyces sp. BPTC-684 TaxID=3043734 RepID=UPI0024B12F7F|nr:hypothetical protein [Streptomyces sp. BPTC-684]WHM38840.1 hypothetical protein QIY60_19240 [Streptomyces sp. BPTC-684]